MQRVTIRRILTGGVGVLALALSVAGCGSAEKVPAETAIKAAESALEAVRADAAKFVPEQLRSAEDALRSAKASFEKGEYKVALATSQALAGQVKDIGAAASAKKAELTKAWAEVSEGLPRMAEAIKSRVDILSQSKKLPAGLDKDKFESAKAGLEEVNKGWASASEAFKSGNLTDAIGRAKVAKDKAVEAMTALNMQVPPAAR
jgi:vacuolar-type H+-ATPase subunit E/Vma4